MTHIICLLSVSTVITLMLTSCSAPKISEWSAWEVLETSNTLWRTRVMADFDSAPLSEILMYVQTDVQRKTGNTVRFMYIPDEPEDCLGITGDSILASEIAGFVADAAGGHCLFSNNTCVVAPFKISGESCSTRVEGPYLPDVGNNQRTVNKELASESFRAILSNVTGLGFDTTALPSFKLWREEDTGFCAPLTNQKLYAVPNGVSVDQMMLMWPMVKRYCKLRSMGHSANYSRDSLLWSQTRVSVINNPLRLKVLANDPTIPDSWLESTTNTYSVTRWESKGGGSNGFDKIELNYHVFKVVDPPITWIYGVDEHYPEVDLKKRDSQEDDMQTAPLIAEAWREAEKAYNGYKGFGMCHVYWTWVQEYLKKEYGIKWLSPKNLEPLASFD